MSKFYEGIRNEIQSFCEDFDYSFSKLEAMSMGWNDEDEHVSFSCKNPHETDDISKGLSYQARPLGILLVYRGKNGVLVFEQTEHTKPMLATLG